MLAQVMVRLPAKGRVTDARHWLGALLLPLLICSATPAQALLRCTHDQALRHHCCCPGHATRTPAPSAMLGASCCCKLEVQSAAVVPAAALRAPTAPDFAAATLLPQARTLPAPIWTAQPTSLRLDRASGPPIILRKQSLLI